MQWSGNPNTECPFAFMRDWFVKENQIMSVGAGQLPDYREDPDAYEIEERSRPDEMAMIGAASDTSVQCLNSMKDAKVLDICCGTGLSMAKMVGHPNMQCLVGVDICKTYLDYARKVYAGEAIEPTFILGDAITTPLPFERWDLIMMASAYHHIEDARKVSFLKRIRSFLGPDGRGIIAENILPDYVPNDYDDYCRAVRFFYREVLTTARAENPNISDHVVGLIERVAQYGFDGCYEYKVCLPVLLGHLEEAGLRIISSKRVWPEGGTLAQTTGGNYVFVVSNANASL